ncbi:protein ANTAGONIST OF LIKE HETEROCHROMATIN PROTEIN 1-like [Sitophilus oryzae]|uniref:Protein ANTAGONIST OF LIKE HETEROCHROMATIN PROTEIN 1-like n=1 Tax=Sitophilus oryzae TaxID=7048 RepID=A0A6J2XL44_SITOR|nr:protein ANTAGONIST OF LIKE HETEROCHROMATIN PROTEIN 1-like [Sitophilus oryzae]
MFTVNRVLQVEARNMASTHKFHYNKNKKQDAWNEIAKYIGTPIDIVKLKINSLLSSFRREGKELKKENGYLAAGSSMKSLSYNYRLGLSTVSNIIKSTCSALWISFNKEYLPIPDKEKWLKIATDFEMKWNFPNCLGAIDGKHVRIQAPPNTGSDYYNYKDFFSLILLAICDANYCFTVIDIGAKGRQSDGGVFRNNNFGKQLFSNSLDLPPPRRLTNDVQPIPYYIIGDAAFPFGTNLMRPYPGNFLPQEKRIFNYRLSRARRVIENTFGILVSKWRILERPIIAKLETIAKMIAALVCLHNFLKKSDAGKSENNKYCPSSYVDQENEAGEVIEGEWRTVVGTALSRTERFGGNSYSQRAASIRSLLTDYFVNIAPIPPQWTK